MGFPLKPGIHLGGVLDISNICASSLLDAVVFTPRSLDSSLGGVIVQSTPSQQIDFRAELVSLLDNQIRYLH